MTDQPTYMPGPPPNLGPTMQQLAQPEEPKQWRKRRSPSPNTPSPAPTSRRKKSRAAPSKPAKQVRRRKSKSSVTVLSSTHSPAAPSPATPNQSDIGQAIGLAVMMFQNMEPGWRTSVLDVLDTLYRPRQA